MTDSLVICLHGVGSSGRDLEPLARTLSSRLPGVTFATPDGPARFDSGPGRQWFSVAGITPALRPARIEAARPAFDRVIEAEVAGRGLLDRLDRVALLGFSQGSIMALDAIASGRWPVAAVVAASGRLAMSGVGAAPRSTRVLLLHGEADAVIAWTESRDAAVRLRALGFEVEAKIYPHLGHGFSAEGVLAASEFLASVFARRQR